MATTKLINCDRIIPIPRPTTNEIMPINNIYFFTLILGVAIFYVFNALGSQTVMMDVSSSTEELIELMMTMLSGVSVFVSFILGF